MDLLNNQCSFIKADGERCRIPVNNDSDVCWAHSPENSAKRSKTASKAARSKGNKEVGNLKREIRALIEAVREDEVDRNVAAVMFQGYRCLKDLIQLERQIREQEEIVRRIDSIEERLGLKGRGPARRGRSSIW